MNFKLLWIIALCVGAGAAQAATVSLSPSTVSTRVGDQAVVEVIVSGLSGIEVVGGFDLDVTFDSSVLSAAGVSFGSALGVDGVGQFTSFVLSVGRIDFAAVSLLDGVELVALQSGPFAIARLTFDALAVGSSGIAFDLSTAPGALFSDEFGRKLEVAVGTESTVAVTGIVSGVPELGSLTLSSLGLLCLLGYRLTRRPERASRLAA